MVTKRARQWLSRGAVIAVALIVLALGSTTWYLSSHVEASLLRVPEDRVPERVVFDPDPSAVGLDYTEVLVDGPLGAYPAWWVEASDDIWMILVHGADADRRETIRVLPTAAAAGFDALAVTYRNDGEAPDDGSGRHHLGRAEWPDLRAALDFAREEGARRVVLYGFGTGASLVGSLISTVGLPDEVVGVVLDAPMLDAGSVAVAMMERDKAPAFVASWAKAMVTFRFGLPWSTLDHVRNATDWDVPVLVFHGEDDAIHPVDVSRRFVEAAPAATLITVAGAGHGESWNVDPERYEAALRAFLEESAIGN